MAWVVLDDKLRTHPKVLTAGAEAAWMWVAAIGYCQEHLTDGFVPTAAFGTLGVFRSSFSAVAARAVRAGLFEEVEGGIRVHDYLAHNPSRAKVLEEREKARKRKADYRASQGETQGVVPGVSHGDTNGTGLGQGRPSRARVPAGLGISVSSALSGEGAGEGFDAQPWFDRVYAAYPNKARKNAALAVWHRDITDEATAAAILADVQARVANGWVRIERRFIPQLLTYLEERQWEDAPQTEPVTDTRLHDLPVTWCCQKCGGIHETPAGEPLTCRKAIEELEPPSIPFSELVARHAAKGAA